MSRILMLLRSCALSVLGSGALLLPVRGSAAAAEASSACDALVQQVDGQPGGPLFLPSFPTVTEGPLYRTTFVYDQSVAAIALMGCGHAQQARLLADALLAALERDRYWHDGRLRNGYAAGIVAAGPGPVKLGGWWDKQQGRWLEDRYQVGSDVGNMAWAILALLAVRGSERESSYVAAAQQIGHWIEKRRDTRGAGGFTGGTEGSEPTPAENGWKSSEHNTDLAAAFGELATATGDARWRRDAAAAARFVGAMWDAHCACFAAGTGVDGVARNNLLALDAQVWPLLAIPGAAVRYRAVIGTVEKRLSAAGGFAYSEAGTGLWTEGTAQMQLLYALLGQEATAATLHAAVAAERTSDGGYFATQDASSPTGFALASDPSLPRRYLHLSHLGAGAWAALAEQRFNPFIARSALPVAVAAVPAHR
ncbi:MAG: hypothetical protein ABSE43_14200 [Steroidobacteraceae bacterium]